MNVKRWAWTGKGPFSALNCFPPAFQWPLFFLCDVISQQLLSARAVTPGLGFILHFWGAAGSHPGTFLSFLALPGGVPPPAPLCAAPGS